MESKPRDETMLKFSKNDGYVEVAVDEAVARLDLYEAYNQYARICSTCDDAVERAAAWAEWLAGKGLPGVSHGVAYALAEGLQAEVDAFKKKFTSVTTSPPPA